MVVTGDTTALTKKRRTTKGVEGMSSKIERQEEQTKLAEAEIKALHRKAKEAVTNNSPFALPNSFWKDESNDSKKWSTARVVQFVESFTFAEKPKTIENVKTATKRDRDGNIIGPAVQFELDVNQEHTDPNKNWLEVNVWAQLRLMYLENEKLNVNRERALQMYHEANEESIKQSKKPRSLVRASFELVPGSGIYDSTKRKWNHTYRCIFGGEVKIFGGTSQDKPGDGGGRYNSFLRSKHPVIYDILTADKDKDKPIDESGNIVQFYDFQQIFGVHIRYVVFLAMDNRPQRLGDTPGFKQWMNMIDAQYRPPSCGRVQNALTEATVNVIDNALKKKFKALRLECGNQPFLGLQFDGWSAPNATSMFVAITVTYLDQDMVPAALDIDDVNNIVANNDAGEATVEALASSASAKKFRIRLKRFEALLGFAEFVETSHTGAHIATFVLDILNKYELKKDDIVVATPDGGSNVLLAVRLMGMPLRYCVSHKIQRAVLEGLGPKKNEQFKLIMKKVEGLATKQNHSYKFQDAMKKAQEDAGVPKQNILCLLTASPTRWCGEQNKIRRCNILQQTLQTVLSEDGTLQESYDEEQQLIEEYNQQIDALSLISDESVDDLVLEDGDIENVNMTDAGDVEKKNSDIMASRIERMREQSSDEAAAFALVSTPSSLLPTKLEFKTLQQMEGLLDIFENLTRLTEGNKIASGETSSGFFEAHRVWIAVRSVIQVLKQGKIPVYRPCNPTARHAERRAARTVLPVSSCVDAVKTAHAGILHGFEKRFEEPDDNILMNLLFDKSLNMKALTTGNFPIFTEIQVAYAKDLFQEKLESTRDGLVALERTEFDLKLRELRARAETVPRNISSATNARSQMSPHRARNTIASDDEEEPEHDQSTMAYFDALQGPGFLLQNFEVEDDDDDMDARNQDSCYDESISATFKSNINLENEHRYWASINPSTIKSNFKNKDGTFDNYAAMLAQRDKIPVYYALFKSVASSLASQANTERINSKAKLTLSDHRRRLLSKTFENSLKLGHNFDLFDLDIEDIRSEYNDLRKNDSEGANLGANVALAEAEDDDDDL
eukprot:CAMPEP_0197288452 /NCGR_PEP_ID=MMETSP0890-20130614/5544_1 /TAXON_ID=44058 ORGANISM="Aureoumbra lagunensis, Strain CCMP1510" /NCGR_SAMPLE_ID=MMETSP0890 /ASSEMBLY_ACC=CAM_ASM_000533 /LENGTH=1069 /DNA_ID=CAMNT_0042759189 /DNA_START=91 /DNA_END=3300 /DNA_ORIENTATION=+